MGDIWRAAEARHRFSDLVDAAVEGEPVHPPPRWPRGRRRLEGIFRGTRPNLKTYLLTAGYAGAGEDAFDRAMRGAREEDAMLLEPRDVDLED